MSALTKPPVKLLLAAKEFFTANPKKIRTSECPVARRTYFMIPEGGRMKLVAVGTLESPNKRRA